MEILNYRNAVSASADGDVVDVEIETAEHGWIPTTVIISDPDTEPYHAEIKTALEGMTIGAYVPKDIDLPENVVRAKRDVLLSEDVDSMNPIRWNALTPEAQVLWEAYRQDLLDVPQQAGFPDAVVWPTKPV